ncbi:MAG: hypothetical protein IKO90_07260 [Bacteroidales bacterium]|nr:hypothetical protein [Bacteroidales bacterium]
MKRIITCFAILTATILSAFAQIPQTFSYQAVVRDNNNRLVVEQPMEVYVQILQGSDDGFVVYSEKHYTGTNQNGLLTFELGGGETTNHFASIDWSNAPYFVRTIISFDDAIIQSVTPLLAVPYALYAAKAGNADVDLTKYYSKKDVDAMLDKINAQLQKIDLQLNPPVLGFSVAEDKRVLFSQGNLQYQASTKTWRFAKHQWDYVGSQKSENERENGGTIAGSDNVDISSTYNGWIDLFGWGTSGYNGCEPYFVEESPYAFYGNGKSDIAGTNYDWGVYNTILNGGTDNMWRTLTKEEWNYLLKKRVNATEKYGLATVNNVVGLVLLPDDWIMPKDITFSYGISNGYKQNIYSANEWIKMEDNGAVFLPAAGWRQSYRYADGHVGVYYINSLLDYNNNNKLYGVGSYWSSSIDTLQQNQTFSARSFHFSELSVNGSSSSNPAYGRPVRLVQDIY